MHLVLAAGNHVKEKNNPCFHAAEDRALRIVQKYLHLPQLKLLQSEIGNFRPTNVRSTFIGKIITLGKHSGP